VSQPAANSDPQETSVLASISHAWRALRHPNFKLFFAGQSISVIGTWMTRLATSWLVYRMTHSALLLGVVSFAGQIVSFALGPFAGVWVERLDRRKLLVWTQAAAAVQSLALAALTLAHCINLWEIIALSACQGLINALDMPGRQSFLVQMVEDRNDLSNAIAINSSMANGARLRRSPGW
jgi:MFS family permease